MGEQIGPTYFNVTYPLVSRRSSLSAGAIVLLPSYYGITSKEKILGNLIFDYEVIMQFKKFRPNRVLQKNQDTESVQRLKCQLLVAPTGSFKWNGPISFTVDTGADVLTIPRKLLPALGLASAEVVDTQNAILADGTVIETEVISCNLRFVTNDSANRDVLVDVPCSIVEDGEEPLLGLSVLSFYDYAVISGRLILFGLNTDAWDELPDANTFNSYRLGSVATPPSNVVPPMKQPKAPEPLKPLEPPSSTKPRAGAFIPPAKPIKPVPPK